MVIKRLIVYGAISALALGLELCFIQLLTRVGIHYLVATSVAFIMGLLAVYVLTKKYVFRAETGRTVATDFGLFAGVGLVGLLINDVIIWLAVERVASHVVHAKLYAVVIVFFWNFLARSYLFSSKTAASVAPEYVTE